MTKKKRFGISQALTRGLSETISVVENNTGVFRHVVLPLSRIELDPENPRKLAIDLMDVQYGIKSDDPLVSEKQEELERLKELSVTIKNSGVINPIVVYKNGELYRIVAGERRCLASILAGKQDIDARVFQEKPKPFDLKLLQWVENTAREDLTLHERLENIRTLLSEYEAAFQVKDINATLLKNVTGLSLSQSSYYLAVLNTSDEILEQIRLGHIKNLDKAALLAAIPSGLLRQQAIQDCVAGASLKELRKYLIQTKGHAPKASHVADKGKDKKESVRDLVLARFSNTLVIKRIVDAVLTQKEYQSHAKQFERVEWKNIRQAKQAFHQLVHLVETSLK